jgi:hypothetical protein
METGFARAVVDQVTPLRVCLNTDQTQTGYYHVLIWDGDPADGGQLLADKRVQGVDQNGDTCVWIENFRADEPGAWSIYAQVLETREDGLVGNAVDTLQVQVDDIPNLMPLRARGRASRVGVAEAVGAVILTAVFPYDGDLDLPGTTAVIASVLDEMAGSGELVPGIEEDAGQDLVLEPLWSSANIALFQTPQGQEPIVRLSLWRHKGALFVAFQVSKARILEPAFCGAVTELSTDLLLLDAENPPVNLEITELWQCKTGPTGEVRELVLPGIW